MTAFAKPAPATRELRLISWNVNGLRAVMKKDPGFVDVVRSSNADIFAIQETKLQADQVAKLKLDEALPAYHQVWSHAERKGYSGTAVFCREEPEHVERLIGSPAADDEGRVCALDFGSFWFVDVYVPNAKQGLLRIGERQAWDERYREYLVGLAEQKPVITCGDFNVAHEEIDLKNPGPNRGNAGFSDEERADFDQLLAAGFHDTFRERFPDLAGAYSWWSYRGHARQNNAGWRIDYFLVSDGLQDRVRSASILDEVYGSDHCPVELEIEI